ncbi:hypothetical protein V4V59_002200 [Vibrio mimicus]
MDIRLFLRPLLFAFLFLFSASTLAQWTVVKHFSGVSDAYSNNFRDCKDTYNRLAPYIPLYKANHLEILSCTPDGSLYLVTANFYGFTGQTSCPSGTFPTYPNLDCTPEPPQCNSDQVLDPSTNTCVPAPTCPEAGTKDKSSYGPPNLLGFSSCTANNCIIKVGTTDDLLVCTGGGTPDEQCNYTTYYTGQACTYNPDNTTWNPPGHEWPEVPKPDLPVPDQPDLPLPDSGGGNGGYDPDAGIDDNFTPPNPDTSPDTDNPNLSADGSAGVVNELNSSNKSLQNIEAILTQTRRDQNKHAASQERYNSGILGALNSINKSVSGASGSGGGGNGDHVDDGDSGSGCDPEKEKCESGLNFGRPEVKDPFETILDASDIADYQTKTETTKTTIKSKIDEIKNLITVPQYDTGGTIPATEFTLTHQSGNIQVKNDALQRISPDISTILTFAVAVICFSIVTARR